MPYHQRMTRVKAAMQKAGFDAIVCRLPEHVLLLSGYWPLSGMSYVIYPLAEDPVFIVPHTEESEARQDLGSARILIYRFGVLDAADPAGEIKNLFRSVSEGKNWKRIGYEGSFAAAAPPWNAAEPALPSLAHYSFLVDIFGSECVQDACALLDEQKSVKTEQDLARLRTVNEIANLGLARFLSAVEPGKSGVELVADVERTIMCEGTGHNGARRVRAFAQVSTGPEETAIGYRPMVITSMRRMKSGDIALLELAVVADGYWCDRTRPKVAGPVDDRKAELFSAVKEAQTKVIGFLRDGVISGDADEQARRVIAKAGLEKHFIHITGHGVGFRYHDPAPFISPGSIQILKTGMVHTVEPGVYIEGIGGIRTEDNVFVRAADAEVLAPLESSI